MKRWIASFLLLLVASGASADNLARGIKLYHHPLRHAGGRDLLLSSPKSPPETVGSSFCFCPMLTSHSHA